MFVTFFLAVTLSFGSSYAKWDYHLILREEMNMKENVCWAYRKIELLCLYNAELLYMMKLMFYHRNTFKKTSCLKT